MKKYKRAITYGTFNLFHIGHLNLLERISELADEVVVGVSSDVLMHLKENGLLFLIQKERGLWLL